MTTVESGVAIGQPYPKHEERATAIHEAGHAVCGHLYMENRLSTRLSIRKRGSSGGHHQAMEIEDRFGHWRSEQVGNLIWGARRDGRRVRLLRPEHDGRRRRPRRQTTQPAAHMVGVHGMAPRRSTSPTASRTPRRARRPRSEVMERFERVGFQLMHRSGSGMMDADPFACDARRPRQAAARRRPARAGVRGRLEHDAAQPRGHASMSPSALIARRRALRRRRDATCWIGAACASPRST